MDNTEQARPELVALSADYFASNPDVDKLLVVVGSQVFYRPERESLAAHEAAVAETSVMTIHRHESEGTPAPLNLVDVEGASIDTEFPAVVGTLELILGSIKLEFDTPRDLAEALYLAGVQAGLPRAAVEAQLEAVADFLLSKMAQGMSAAPSVAPALATVLPSPLDELLVGALHLPGILADAPAAPALDLTTEELKTLGTALVNEKPAAAPKAVKAAKPAKAVTKKKATTPKAAK